MGEVTELRPLVLGYAQLGPFADQTQFTAVQGRLAAYAQQAGLMLGTVYFERAGTAPEAFTDLLAAVVRNRVTGVVVPSLSDFGDLEDERVTELEDGLSVVVHEAGGASANDPRDSFAVMNGGADARPLRPRSSRLPSNRHRQLATTREEVSSMRTAVPARPWGVRRASESTQPPPEVDPPPTVVTVDRETQLGVYRDPSGELIQAGPPKHGTSRAQFKSLATGGGDGSKPSSPDDTKVVEYVPD